MKIYFDNQLTAVMGIAQHAKNEVHFKIMREELDLNHLLTDQYFIHKVTLELEELALAA